LPPFFYNSKQTKHMKQLETKQFTVDTNNLNLTLTNSFRLRVLVLLVLGFAFTGNCISSTWSKSNPQSTSELILSENFNAPNSAWTTYSVASNHNWHYSTSADATQGRNSSVGMTINNYNADANSEDWLITPKLSVSGLVDAKISYWLLSKYSGSSLDILYSADYTGTGNPSAYTWVSIEHLSSFPTSWTEKFIDLSAINTDVYIAFKHTSGYASNSAAAICIDDFSLFTGSSPNNGDAVDANSLTHSETFDVVSWNLEWFGAPQQSGHATSFDQQLTAVSAKIIELDADIYALQELVTDALNGDFLTPLITKLNQLVGSELYVGILAPRYSYDFQAPTAEYPAQRLCFIYNKNTVSPLTSYSMFSNLYPNNSVSNIEGYTGSASSFWSSGRMPFLMSANVTIGGVSQTIKMVNIHAKCCSDSYSRKLADALFLIKELNTNYTADNLIVLGDYNDYLTGSMSGGESPYASWFTTNEYVNHVLTSSSKIDHITISNELYDEHGALFNNTSESSVSISDHKPIMLRLLFASTSTGATNDLAFEQQVVMSPIPTQDELTIRFNESQTKQVYLITTKGEIIEHFEANSQLTISLSNYPKGIYFVRIVSGNNSFTRKIVK